MKKIWVSCGIWVCLAAMFQVHAQGFINLDFESASIPISQPPSPVPNVDIGLALPGWSAFIGTNQVSLVMYNSQTLDTSSVSIFRSNHPVEYTSLNLIEGAFSVFFMGGYTEILPGLPFPTDTSLSQTGLIPETARSLQFKTTSDRVVAFLDGQLLPLATLQSTPEYVLKGADVTPFIGQTKELRFTIFASRTGAGGYPGVLDSIVFSPDVIPEPSLLSLLVLGVLFFGWRLSLKPRS
jgi:hypothetical protein